jgi:DNA topoisomerase-1
LIRDSAALDRIRSLVIPPNWTNVWICPSPRGHVQATGRDAKGRKQYLYHAKYRAFREETKFGRMSLFGRALPKLRARVSRDLRKQGLPREKVLAAVVRLLDVTRIRVGNDEYARHNGSFGLTTLRDRHARVNGTRIQFQFKAKSGKECSVSVDHPRLARVVKHCRDLPGYDLFQYMDESGARVPVDSAMVNEYLREATGADFTAKDFRTWHGTVCAMAFLAERENPAGQTAIKRNIVAALKLVAGELSNLPSTCRKHYVHPGVLEAYADGALSRYASPAGQGTRSSGLSASERAVMKFLTALASPRLRRAA